MAIPILHFWQKYFENPDEGLGSTYERFIINDLLFQIVEKYDIKSVLETPSFGFTGLSGINSLGLALKGLSVTVTEDNEERFELVSKIWSRYCRERIYSFRFINNDNSTNYGTNKCVPYDFSSMVKESQSEIGTTIMYDMTWNFSALWFVDDLELFLKNISDITDKVILIMVPNRTGLGYLQQKYFGKEDLKKYLNEEYIKPENFVPILNKLGWELIKSDYIDCPLWPDIGMSKENFMRKIGLSFLLKNKPKKTPLTILDYYSGKDTQMKDRILKLDFFERYAPNFFKKFWAHHKYFLFVTRK